MKLTEDLRLSRDFKYIALYTALHFFEQEQDVYVKKYADTTITIYANEYYAHLPGITMIHKEYLPLTEHKSFVILECMDKLLTMGYKPSEIIIDFDNEYDIYCKNLYIRCFEWKHMEELDLTCPNKDVFLSINYESRLISGVIERNTKIKNYTGLVYDYGVFEHSHRLDTYCLFNKENICCSKEFMVDGDKLIGYQGRDKKVVVPDGIKEIGSAVFWDNPDIEEAILPESLLNLGGDTFYNCKNLKKIIIPKNVYKMGNNPFAGCPNLKLVCESPYFIYKNDALYTQDKKTLIYFSCTSSSKEFRIPETVERIGKHAFYLCNTLEKIYLPKSLRKMENNPFSGCEHLSVINDSEYYHFVDKVIYDRYYTSVCGCLNSIVTDCLTLLPIKRINRNSFWNCKGIKKIILPETLEAIGYNPFVGCNQIVFENKSPHFHVQDGVLYNATWDKLICYPAHLAIGEVHLLDSVRELERGAFSGCDQMTKIYFRNVSVISKSCFTNCVSLKNVYCSDFVHYIGEWAFGHCIQLKTLSVGKECILDTNALKNTPANLIRREAKTNYVIESENYHTLRMLQETYTNKIDSILIDPPYNSNISYIEYQDQYDNYKEYMRKRIELAYPLLSKHGFLLLHIDKKEVKNLYKICKSIFGSSLVSLHKWKKLHPFFDQNRMVHPNKKRVLYEYIILCRKSKESHLKRIHQPYLLNGNLYEKEASFPKVWDCFGTTSSAKDEIQAIFSSRTYFSTPKPLKLIEELIRATTDSNSLILDFFAGSGTTGHACVVLNQEDGGNRKYILVSNAEADICKKVTYERVRRIDEQVVLLD